MGQKHYTLTFEYRPEYLYARVGVDVITLEIGVAYINELISELRRSGVKKVLFLRETPAVLSKKDYTVLVNVFTNMLPDDVRFAVVDHSPQPRLISDVIRSETESRRRLIRPFDSIEDAEQWLLDR